MEQHPEDPRPGSKRARAETVSDLGKEYLASPRDCYLAEQAYRKIAETLEKIDEGPNIELQYEQFLVHCEQIHNAVTYYLNSNAGQLSTVENGGVFTRHMIQTIYDSDDFKRHSEFKSDPNQGRYLWHFNYVGFYDTFFNTVSPFNWYSEDGTLNVGTIFDVLEATPVLREVQSDEILTVDDFLERKDYRIVHDKEVLAKKYQQFDELEHWQDITGDNEAIHQRWQERNEQILEQGFAVAWRRTLQGFHGVELKNLYNYKDIYTRCARKDLLEDPSVQHKIGIAFIMNHRYKNPTQYTSKTNFPHEKLRDYALRISTVTMPLEQMTENEKKDARLRMDMGEYLYSILGTHREFFENYLRSRPNLGKRDT